MSTPTPTTPLITRAQYMDDPRHKLWDELAFSLPVRPSLFARTGETRALVSLVCIAKEAAQQWIDNQGDRHAN